MTLQHSFTMMIPNHYTWQATLPHMDVSEYCSTASMVVIVRLLSLPVLWQRVNETTVNSTKEHLDHQFLYGRLFPIITDQYHLLQLLGDHRPVHTTDMIERYSWIPASYNYKLEFRSTKHHNDADTMSRLPIWFFVR